MPQLTSRLQFPLVFLSTCNSTQCANSLIASSSATHSNFVVRHKAKLKTKTHIYIFFKELGLSCPSNTFVSCLNILHFPWMCIYPIVSKLEKFKHPKTCAPLMIKLNNALTSSRKYLTSNVALQSNCYSQERKRYNKNFSSVD